MEKTNFDKYNYGNLDIKKLNSLIKRNIKILDNYFETEELKNLAYGDLIELLSNTEYMENVIRTSISHIDNLKLVQLDKENKSDKYKSIIVLDEENALNSLEQIKINNIESLQTTASYNNGVFEFYVPLTFKRGFQKSKFMANYTLANWLEDTIKYWAKKNNFVLEDRIKKPYILVMKRVVDKFVSDRDCDADNFENQRIINTITHAFSLNDNPTNMRLFSTFEQNPYKKNGTYFYLFSVEDMEKHLDLFRNNFNLKK